MCKGSPPVQRNDPLDNVDPVGRSLRVCERLVERLVEILVEILVERMVERLWKY